MSGDKPFRLNEEITARQVRLIDADGAQIGIVNIQEALQTAVGKGLDLAEISPNAKPPVCRILNYGKYLYEQSKQRAQAKKRQKQIQIKEIKFRPTTEEGDYRVKLRNLIRFLEHGDKAKITLRYRGREMVHMELGEQLMKRLQLDLELYGTIEQMPRLEGRQMVMLVGPKRKESSKK